MEESKSWTASKHLKRINSTEILIKRRSVEPSKKTRSISDKAILKKTPKRVGTPKRKIKVLSPSEYVEINEENPKKKYSSIRRINFN